ncbi:MAG: nuclear transport factor 2 family protein [Chthonomonadales bacterium]
MNNINTLAELVDPNVKISIFRKGKYEYSLNSNDYLDMTRDMLKSTETITIDLYRFHKRANGVMVISGKHVYLDRDNRERTVYVSFVMERIGGRWTLTQAGTAPDRIDEPR